MLWTKQVGKYLNSTYAEKITTDYKGNIYLSGYTSAVLSDGIQHGKYDYFIAKYNESGNLIYGKQFGSKDGKSMGTDIIWGNEHYLYTTGYTDVGLFGQIQIGGIDYLVTKWR